jgi:hypothetical protein
MFVVSIDPGTVHCAVVRYDILADRVTHARLYNLVCTCPPSLRRMGPMERAMHHAQEELVAHQKLPAKAIKVPTAHDFPKQLVGLIQQDGLDGPFQYVCAGDNNRKDALPEVVVVAVERQNAMDSGNIAVEAALLARYAEQAQIVNPNHVKTFWNSAAHAANLPVAFRTGSHAINKTDAKRMIERILDPSEQALLLREASVHSAHKTVCRSYLKRSKKRTKRSPVKSDDLIDAVLQAIMVAYQTCGLSATNPEGSAIKRLLRGDARTRLDAEAERQWRETTANNKRRKRSRKQRRKRPKKRAKTGTDTTPICID